MHRPLYEIDTFIITFHLWKFEISTVNDFVNTHLNTNTWEIHNFARTWTDHLIYGSYLHSSFQHGSHLSPKPCTPSGASELPQAAGKRVEKVKRYWYASYHSLYTQSHNYTDFVKEEVSLCKCVVGKLYTSYIQSLTLSLNTFTFAG